MKSIINLFKKSLSFPVVWVGVIYLFWFVVAPIPIEDNFIIGIRSLAIYIAIVILEKLLGGNKILSNILLLVLVPVAFLAGLFLLNIMIETLGWLYREIIYVPLILLFSGYAAYKLYQRPANDNKTLRVLLFVVTLPVLALNFAYSVTYFPDVDDRKDVAGERYYLVWALDIDGHGYFTLYKCQKRSIQCENLYRTYGKMWIDTILVDKENNEISVIDGDFDMGLAFTYGENSRSYDGYPVQLGDHIYQLSINHDYGSCEATGCDDYIYIVYECNLDYTSCDPLQIQYRVASNKWIYLDANETKSEINAYDEDDNLIFTYGENPACYMDGCVILDQ